MCSFSKLFLVTSTTSLGGWTDLFSLQSTTLCVRIKGQYLTSLLFPCCFSQHLSFWAPRCPKALGYLGGILTSPYKQKPWFAPLLSDVLVVLLTECGETLALPQHVQDIRLDLPCRECSRCVSVCVKLDRWSLAQGIRHTKAVFTQLWYLRLKDERAGCLGWCDMTQALTDNLEMAFQERISATNRLYLLMED